MILEYKKVDLTVFCSSPQMSTSVLSHTHKTKTHDIRKQEKNSAAVLLPSVSDLASLGREGSPTGWVCGPNGIS